jgi:hypothetical protein
METVWHLPRIEIRDLKSVTETRPTALLTGANSWDVAGKYLNFPLFIQA